MNDDRFDPTTRPGMYVNHRYTRGTSYYYSEPNTRAGNNWKDASRRSHVRKSKPRLTWLDWLRVAGTISCFIGIGVMLAWRG